jgi:hypothetical protein
LTRDAGWHGGDTEIFKIFQFLNIPIFLTPKRMRLTIKNGLKVKRLAAPVALSFVTMLQFCISCSEKTSKPDEQLSGKKTPIIDRTKPKSGNPNVQTSKLPQNPKKVTETNTNQSWRNKGDGKERHRLLSENTKSLSTDGLGEWLIENAQDLSDLDEAFFVELSPRLSEVTTVRLAGCINAATSPELKKRLLAAMQEQTFGKFTPDQLFTLADTLQPAEQRTQLVINSIEGWLQTNPAAAISSAGRALSVVKGGSSDATRAYMELAPAFKNIPKKHRDEVWALLPTADDKMRNSIIFRLVEGQYRNDSLDATQWLNSLPTSDLKSHAVDALVAQLVIDNDKSSAKIWADSAAEYLTPSDRNNINRLLEESK